MSIEKNVNQVRLNNDPCAKALTELIDTHERELDLQNAVLYYSFPFYLEENNSTITADVLVISRNYGVFVFKCSDVTTRNIDDSTIKNINDRAEQIYSQIFSRLIKNKLLREKPTTLRIQVFPILYLSNFEGEKNLFNKNWADLNIILNYTDLHNFCVGNRLVEPLEEVLEKEILATLEGSKGIIKPQERDISDSAIETKGGILNRIESEIANFDTEQKRGGLFIIDGPQRIRGLAGSGKTIVLTMKAAQLHLQDPNAEILYTFYTKSLYDFIKRLITRFFRQFAEKDPNWEKIHILHAWGGRNLKGVYYDVCTNFSIQPKYFSEVKDRENAFNEVCKSLLEENETNLKEIYDYSILDEAQDFPKYFYQLCLKITKNKRLIWGYDECQNILNIKLQDTKETFGKAKDGNYQIDFSTPQANAYQDMVLHKCYRNPRKILVSAFALGLGIYNDPIIQMPENNGHWEDLGFEVTNGNSRAGDKMIITRPEKNSPLAKNKLLESGDILKVKVFTKVEDECFDIAESVENDIKDFLLPHDILIITLDDKNARVYFELISRFLEKKVIKTFNLLSAPAYNTTFSMKDHVTLSTVYRAKGNEAGSVYIVGVDSIFANKDSIQERNKLFTAITRSKAWVTITGMGKNTEICQNEVEAILKNYPNLVFTMPDRTSLKNLQRDLSNKQLEFNILLKAIDEVSSKTGISREDLAKKILESDKKK